MTRNTLMSWWSKPAQRRLVLTVVSGGLIAAALAAGALFQWPLARLGLMTAAAVVAGVDIAWRAVQYALNRRVSIELLVTIAAVGALAIGNAWEAAAVTFLFILGAYLEARTMSRTRRALKELLDLAPAQATVVRDGHEVEVAPQAVQVGETVLVKPGGRIPVDGTVIDGQSNVDESAITGEPMPATKASDDPVFAGTINQAGLLRIRAEGVGADTTLARIVRRVEEAQESKAPTQRFIERFSQWYTPAIIGLSVVAFVISWNIELALTLLVIGCPGALVISTPVSVVAGIGRAAKGGILIKGGEHLERAGKISAVALDKTGTITEGRPKLTDVVALQPTAVVVAVAAGDAPPRSPMESPEDDVVYWAAIAERSSEHPLARPILDAARERTIDVPEADAFETQTGRGIRAHYGDHQIVVGSRAWLNDPDTPVTDETDDALARLKAEGKTAILVARDGEVIGVLGIADAIRDMAPTMIRRLHEAGVERVVMLTGDDERTAQAIATDAGIDDVRADLLPEEKQDAIQDLQNEGEVVAMIGDGINDAPAMAQADIGIAMGAAGTDVAIETADIALMADALGKVPEAISLSKRLLRNIRQNVGVALATVVALLAGVLVGEVRMAGGMFVHEVSVLIVILNGMRLMRA